MFCPRCGKSVNENANFCGGCGLSKLEIDRLASQTVQSYTAPVFEPVPEQKGEIENFVEQPFPTDVEFREVSNEAENINKKEPTFEDLPNYNIENQAENINSNNYNASSNKIENQDSEIETEPPLSTVDFIWMMIISIIPIVGQFYLIWLAFIQDNSTNKRSYARATLIIALFAILIVVMFVLGFVVANLVF